MNFKKYIEDIPFYKELYKDLKDSDFSTENLSKLPKIEKTQIAKNFPDIWMSESLKKAIGQEEYEFMNTSGTTDEKLIMIRPKNWWTSIEKRMYRYLKNIIPDYTEMRSKAILTTAICSNTVCYTETPPYEKRLVNGILHLNITPDPNNWTEEDIQRIVDEIDLFKPQCFQADPVYLAIFFKLLNKYNLKLPKWIPKGLLLAYEYCPKKCINFIKKHWNIPTAIIFGTTEAGINFYQCSKGFYHWMDDDCFINFKPIFNKENIYEILITSFRNPYMPLINYNVKDLVYIDPKQTCSCNGNKIIVTQFMGRSKDLTYTKSNKIITTGEIDNYLAQFDNNILVYNLIFSSENKLIFNYTTTDDEKLKDVKKKEIVDLLNNLYEYNYIIETNFLREILPAPSGKFAIIKKNYE